MAAGWRGVLDAWDDFRIEAAEYRRLDGERVLVIAHYRGRGKTSKLELGMMPTNVATLFHVRDDKVTRLVYHWDRDRALADLGLAVEEGSPGTELQG